MAKENTEGKEGVLREIKVLNEQGIGAGRAYSEKEFQTPIRGILPNIYKNAQDTRLFIALFNARMDYVGDILERSETDLRAIWGISENSYKYLIKRLQEFDYLPKPEEDKSLEEPKIFRAEEGAITLFD